MSIKINSLQLENVKRVKAVELTPSSSGLTIVGGNNEQGKTSVLDAIAWTLGGDRLKPSEPRRDGSEIPPSLHIELSNGLVVERKGKNSDLKVIDPSGNKAGQNLLNEFVEQFALNLPKFMESNNKDKAGILLKIIGVGEKLYELENREQSLYNQRHSIGQIRDQKKAAAEEMESFPDAPEVPVSATELIKEQQDILAKNGENQRKRDNLSTLRSRKSHLESYIEDIKRQLSEAETNLKAVNTDIDTAQKSVSEIQDESTAEIEKSIANIEDTNRKVRVNQDKAFALSEAENYTNQYDDLTEQIEDTRKEKFALLDGADLPLEGLSVDDNELTYKGYKWDNMSGSNQLKVATAIVRKLNPNCGFVLMDKLEQMDTKTLKEFGQWLKEQDLQVIATRVSTGEECTIIIEDGYGVNQIEPLNSPELRGDDDPWK